MTEFLAQFGYLGMFISALLAGSVLPFNSEVVIGALKVMGLDPWILLIAGTVGNVLGGLFILILVIVIPINMNIAFISGIV